MTVSGVPCYACSRPMTHTTQHEISTRTGPIVVCADCHLRAFNIVKGKS